MTNMPRICVIQDDKEPVVSVRYGGTLHEVKLLLSLHQPRTKIEKVAQFVMVERVKTPIKDLVMLVDEEGQMKNLPVNRRAMMFYPGVIYGSAVLTYEKEVIVDGEPDMEWIGIPDNFDFKLVAEVAYQRICASLGEHPSLQEMDMQ